jgi:hypothetical protein
MRIWSNHASALLPFILLPIAFGCQKPYRLTDGELSHRLTSHTSHEPGRITLSNKTELEGYLVALRGDSLEWYDSPDGLAKERHASAAENVLSVYTRTSDGTLPLWFGLGGCAIGGCTACTGEMIYSVGSAASDPGSSSPKFNVGGPLIGAVGGAAIGAIIGIASDPGSLENTWQYKIHTARQETARQDSSHRF